MKAPALASISKVPTGIKGLDDITRGGLPGGRATLLAGGPGSGKTLLALQTLVNGARSYGEPGIFVAFEESARRITANAASLGWDLEALQKKHLFFLDAQLSPEMIQAGGFDLSGMLSALTAKARAMKARRIVFDSVDVLLELLGDPAAERHEVFRLHEWLLEQELTAIITSKVHGETALPANQQGLGFMQFMVDCALAMNHEVREGVSQRNLRIIKYRGTSFSENETPFVIGSGGLEVAGSNRLDGPAQVTSERVSSGVKRLDAMLCGGYHRGASVLITGSPGTAKSTLGGAFAAAACSRGEPTLLVSFDSAPLELVRNLDSVGLGLGKLERRGLLRVVSARAGDGSAEAHFFRIKGLAREHQAKCLIIDPISALAKQGNEQTAHNVIERLVDWGKSAGITLLCTSLLDGTKPDIEGTSLQISTIADTWIHLNYLVHAGERNRGLTIIKSRGTAHSNQVRELILANDGITLEDVYTGGGAVLMGTLRWEKEEALRSEDRLRGEEASRRTVQLELEETELALRMNAIQRELESRRAERELLRQAEGLRQERGHARQSEMRQLRGGEVEPRSKKRQSNG